jgi:hypothetical protein
MVIFTFFSSHLFSLFNPRARARIGGQCEGWSRLYLHAHNPCRLPTSLPVVLSLTVALLVDGEERPRKTAQGKVKKKRWS